jgi:hypothetical protein
MSRTIGLLVLLAFALAIPCANFCTVAAADGVNIAALDICSHDAPGTTGHAATIAEPTYTVTPSFQVAGLPTECPCIYESTLFSPEDRPPVA